VETRIVRLSREFSDLDDAIGAIPGAPVRQLRRPLRRASTRTSMLPSANAIARVLQAAGAGAAAQPATGSGV
jgi:hypothetical protein